MKRTVFVSGLLVCLLTLGSIFVSCNNGSNDTNTYDPIVYESAKGDTTYKLELTKNTGKVTFTPAGGDHFKMTIRKTGGSPQISSGSIQSVSDNTFTLAHTSGGTFTVTASASAGMTNISGTIPIDGSVTPITAPGAVNPNDGDGGGDPTAPTQPTSPQDVNMAGTTWKGEGNDNGRVYVGVISFTTANNVTISWTWKDDGTNAGNDPGTYTVKGNSVTLNFGGEVTTVTVNNNTFVLHGVTFIKQ
jgi:hypothetical protein